MFPLLATLLSLVAAPPQGVTVLQMDKIIPPTVGDSFGFDVSYGDGTLAAADPGTNELHMFVKTNQGWTFEQTITSPLGPTDDQFPLGVAVEGDALVTSGRIGFGASHVWAFRRASGSWSLDQELLPSEPSSLFGYRDKSISLSGDLLVIGDIGSQASGQIGPGACYVFRRSGTTWTEESRLIASDGVNSLTSFGEVVDVDGANERLIVGAMGARTGGVAAGKSYVFERTGGTWFEAARLESATIGQPTVGRWGHSAAIDGNVAVMTRDGVSFTSADAEIYRRDPNGNWNYEVSIPRPVPYVGLFGADAAVRGNLVAIGAAGTFVQPGAVHLYSDDGGLWNQAANIEATDPQAGACFGSSFHLGDRFIVVGSPDSSPLTGGAVYGAQYCPELGTTYCAANLNSSGLAAHICAAGSAVLADQEVRVLANSVPSTSFGYFLMSQGTGVVPNFGGSQGDLCLGGGLTIYRFSLFVQQSPGVGTVGLDIPWQNMPSGVQIQAGETWNFQFWFRDANPNVTSNTSDAVSITFQ